MYSNWNSPSTRSYYFKSTLLFHKHKVMGLWLAFSKVQRGPNFIQLLGFLAENPNIFGLGSWPIKIFTSQDGLMTSNIFSASRNGLKGNTIFRLEGLGLWFLFSLYHKLDSRPTTFPHWMDGLKARVVLL